MAVHELWRQGVRRAENPISDVVFDVDQKRPDRRDHVMERNRDDRRNRIAPQREGQTEREQSLQAEERGESHEHPDRDTTSDGMRLIFEIQQPSTKRRHVAQHALEEVGLGILRIWHLFNEDDLAQVRKRDLQGNPRALLVPTSCNDRSHE